MKHLKMIAILILLSFFFTNCDDDDQPKEEELPVEEEIDFTFGADLSYVNQILDHGGVYKDNGEVKNPYQIFKDRGNEVVRLRLWHNPVWTKDIYENGTQLYNDLLDVEKAINLSKANGMKVLLDFHYSDTWADPGTQRIPDAWKDVKDIETLKDSVYNYTFKTLSYLNNKGLMPEYVQVGNETNCGMLITDVPAGFPPCNVCNGNWANMGAVFNSGIKAVRDVSSASDVETSVILHVADPVNVQWWFENMTTAGGVSDFDIIGFSYYPIWHTDVTLTELPETVAGFITNFDKKVWILETAYPWTTANNDGYNNIFGSTGVAGYPVSPDGQLALLKTITQKMIDGGGSGVIYWEPAWISSDAKDLWGTGSAWDNSTLFDFDGNATKGFDFITNNYTPK